MLLLEEVLCCSLCLWCKNMLESTHAAMYLMPPHNTNCLGLKWKTMWNRCVIHVHVSAKNPCKYWRMHGDILSCLCYSCLGFTCDIWICLPCPHDLSWPLPFCMLTHPNLSICYITSLNAQPCPLKEHALYKPLASDDLPLWRHGCNVCVCVLLFVM